MIIDHVKQQLFAGSIMGVMINGESFDLRVCYTEQMYYGNCLESQLDIMQDVTNVNLKRDKNK